MLIRNICFLEGLALHKLLEVGSNNRSVMPLDVLGSARATIGEEPSLFHLARKGLRNLKTFLYLGSRFEIFTCKPGIPSKCMSSTCSEYVPALCTHRPSLLPIGWVGEWIGVIAVFFNRWLYLLKICKLDYLEEGEVVTRFP